MDSMNFIDQLSTGKDRKGYMSAREAMDTDNFMEWEAKRKKTTVSVRVKKKPTSFRDRLNALIFFDTKRQ
jgi:hypothetical protein